MVLATIGACKNKATGVLSIILEFKGSLQRVLGEDRLDLSLESPLTAVDLETLMLVLFPVLREGRGEPGHPIAQQVLHFVMDGCAVPRSRPLSDSDLVQAFCVTDANLPT